MTKEKFLYGLNACAVTYHNGQKFYEHDELVKCFEDLKMFEQEPCEDVISREQVKSDYADWFGYGYEDNWFYKHLSNIPPATPQVICPSHGIDCEDCPAYEPKKSEE